MFERGFHANIFEIHKQPKVEGGTLRCPENQKWKLCPLGIEEFL